MINREIRIPANKYRIEKKEVYVEILMQKVAQRVSNRRAESSQADRCFLRNITSKEINKYIYLKPIA
jgi:hypothetical protein